MKGTARKSEDKAQLAIVQWQEVGRTVAQDAS